MTSKLQEFLDQVRECDRIIEQEEQRREGLYERIDKILEEEEIDIISLSCK